MRLYTDTKLRDVTRCDDPDACHRARIFGGGGGRGLTDSSAPLIPDSTHWHIASICHVLMTPRFIYPPVDGTRSGQVILSGLPIR